MDKHEVSRGAVRANVGFIFKPKEDMKLGISAPPKFPMFGKAGAPKRADVPEKHSSNRK